MRLIIVLLASWVAISQLKIPQHEPLNAHPEAKKIVFTPGNIFPSDPYLQDMDDDGIPDVVLGDSFLGFPPAVVAFSGSSNTRLAIKVPTSKYLQGFARTQRVVPVHLDRDPLRDIIIFSTSGMLFFYRRASENTLEYKEFKVPYTLKAMGSWNPFRLFTHSRILVRDINHDGYDDVILSGAVTSLLNPPDYKPLIIIPGPKYDSEISVSNHAARYFDLHQKPDGRYVITINSINGDIILAEQIQSNSFWFSISRIRTNQDLYKGVSLDIDLNGERDFIGVSKGDKVVALLSNKKVGKFSFPKIIFSAPKGIIIQLASLPNPRTGKDRLMIVAQEGVDSKAELIFIEPGEATFRIATNIYIPDPDSGFVGDVIFMNDADDNGSLDIYWMENVSKLKPTYVIYKIELPVSREIRLLGSGSAGNYINYRRVGKDIYLCGKANTEEAIITLAALWARKSVFYSAIEIWPWPVQAVGVAGVNNLRNFYIHLGNSLPSRPVYVQFLTLPDPSKWPPVSVSKAVKISP